MGMQFGRLKVIGRTENSKSGTAMWICECSCPEHNIVTVHGSSLRSGKTKSCGCLQKESLITLRTKHHKTGTRLYHIWKGMRQRCNNSNNPRYHQYGGRGISVCEEWDEFAAFESWALNNGYSDELSLDRIDGDKGYSPSNCRWATEEQQQNNKRDNRRIKIGDKEKTMAEWCREFNLPYRLVSDRIRTLRWSPEEAFEIVEHKDGRIKNRIIQ